jgi:hypothetical protein
MTRFLCTAVGRLFLAIVAASAFAGCDEKLSDIAGPSPDLEPTFSSIQREIFESTDAAGRTACVNCHAPGNPAQGVLNLTTGAAYASLVNAPSRTSPGNTLVIPGDPEGSYLIHKLEGRSGITGLRMPRNGPPYLTDGQILVIKVWIQRGANNN